MSESIPSYVLSLQEKEEYRMERLINLLRAFLIGLVYTSVLYRYFWTETIEAYFIRRTSVLVIVWLYASVALYLYLRQSDRISRVYKYVTTSLDVGLLTATVLLTAQVNTPLIAGYYLIIAFSSARFSWAIAAYSGLLSMVTYFSMAQFFFVFAHNDTTTLIHSLAMICTATTVGFATRRKDSLIKNIANARHERQKVKDILVKYVSDSVAEKVISRGKSDDLLQEGSMDVTVLMSDIRGFTSLSEKMKPEEVVQLLNEYFSTMVNVIFDYEGTLDKFMGDGLFVLFGAPVQENNHVTKAVNAAMKMQQELETFNQESPEWPDLEMGIGLSTGEVIVGEIGSQERKEYTAIGREVNIAERLESLAKPGEILVSGNINYLIESEVKTEELEKVNLDGFNESPTAHRILEISPGSIPQKLSEVPES